MNVAGYRRVSTDDQVDYGFSLEAQETLIHEYAVRRGRPIPGGHCPRHRPPLPQFGSAAARPQPVPAAPGQLCLSYPFTEEMDFTTPWGKLTLAVLVTLAEIYIDKLRAETQKGKLQRAKNGFWNGSIPLGYCDGRCAVCTDPNGPDYCPSYGSPNRSDGQILIPHPIESEAVKQAFTWYVTGHYSDGQIAEKLNTARFTGTDGPSLPFRTKRYPSRGGPGPFSKDSLRDILTRVFYTGVVPYYGVNEKGQKRKGRDPVALYPGRHPALISQAMFEQAQLVRQSLGRNPRQRRQTPARVYPMTGLLRCYRCQAKMRGQTGCQGYRYYICPTRAQRTGNCPQKGIRAERLGEQLHQALLQIELPEEWQDNLLRAQGIDPEKLARQRADLKGRLARAKELYLAGDLDQVAFEAEKLDFKFKLASLRNPEFDDIIAVNKKLRQLQTEWNELTNLKKNKLLQGLVAAVYAQGLDLCLAQATQSAFPL